MPKDPDRPRQFDNAKIGFLLGLKEDHVGYKVFIPAENTRKWAPDVDFDEFILYGDRNRFHDYRLEEVDFSDIPVEDSEVTTEHGNPPLREDDLSTGIEATVMGDTLHDIISIGEETQYEDNEDQFTAEQRIHETADEDDVDRASITGNDTDTCLSIDTATKHMRDTVWIRLTE